MYPVVTEVASEVRIEILLNTSLMQTIIFNFSKTRLVKSDELYSSKPSVSNEDINIIIFNLVFNDFIICTL